LKHTALQYSETAFYTDVSEQFVIIQFSIITIIIIIIRRRRRRRRKFITHT